MKEAARLAFCWGVLLAACLLEVGLIARAASRDVIVVPIQGTVDDGMAHLVARAVDDANASHAAGLVLDINTTGGLVSSAFEIRDAMFRAQVPTVAYVAQRAFSAGALITLSAQKIVMAPGASLGAAEPIPKTIKTVVENWERLTTYYDYPREHWKHLRTSNVVESPFSRVRLRTAASRRFKSQLNATCLIWKSLSPQTVMTAALRSTFALVPLKS